jgi:D-alanyl-D-alanine carboxypeptidase (penicillin-binding protein 5/6)
MRRFLLLGLLLAAVAQQPAGSAFAQENTTSFETKAKQAYLVEEETGTVLLAVNENQSFPAASLAKLMTMDVVFEALKKGIITPETIYPVSEYAWRTGGAPSGTTTMFAALKSQVPVGDLIRGVVVQNANDACIVLAEGLARTEAEFAARMTARARDLGLSRSTFGNATGLPYAESWTTARDLVELSRHLFRDYPDYYPLYAQPDFQWNKIFQRNKNPLLSLNMGVDGLGAGFVEGTGYALAASVARDGTRLFLALGGLSSDKDRTDEAKRILEWGLTSFQTRVLFKADEVIGQASVYGGVDGRVDLVTKEPVEVFVPKLNAERLSGRIVYHWPLRAPVAAGREIAVLKISSGNRVIREVPLMAASAVEVGGLRAQASDAILELMLFRL